MIASINKDIDNKVEISFSLYKIINTVYIEANKTVKYFRIVRFFLFVNGLLTVSAGAYNRNVSILIIIMKYSIQYVIFTFKNINGNMENNIVDRIKHWILLLAWNPKPVNLKKLKNTKIINVSFNIPRKYETDKIIIVFVNVKYNPSKPYWSSSNSCGVKSLYCVIKLVVLRKQKSFK